MREEAWAVTLNIQDDERLEDRVRAVVKCMTPDDCTMRWTIDDIEATGAFGCEVASCKRRKGVIRVCVADLEKILEEDGQVIDLDATLGAEGSAVPLLRIIIRDGVSVDVLGIGKIVGKEGLGQLREVDPGLFLWPP